MPQSEKEIAHEAYRAYQEKMNLQVGDRVMVMFGMPDCGYWEVEMDDYVGGEYEISESYQASQPCGIRLKSKSNSFCANYYFPVISLAVVARNAEEKMITIDGKDVPESRIKKALEESAAKKHPDLNEKDTLAVALLNESIKEKWLPILNEGVKDKGSLGCVLCAKYYDCDGCPIASYAKSRGCNDTPYVDWDDHQDMKHHHQGVVVKGCKKCEKLCSKEISFLQEVRDWVINGREDDC